MYSCTTYLPSPFLQNSWFLELSFIRISNSQARKQYCHLVLKEIRADHSCSPSLLPHPSPPLNSVFLWPSTFSAQCVFFNAYSQTTVDAHIFQFSLVNIFNGGRDIISYEQPKILACTNSSFI